MTKFPLVSVVIVNWNGGQIFEDCLASLKKIDYPNWELIVVDNGSTDGTQKSANVKNKKNVGFAVANNQGYKKSKGKYILFLNNDTLVTPNLLSKLVARAEKDGELGIVQPKILVMDKPSHLDSVGSFLTITGFLQHLGYLAKDSSKYDHEMFIFSAKGACMLVRSEVIEKTELFDEAYISYMEETDFCWRVWLAGYKVLYYPKVQILHKVGMTSKRLSQTKVNYHSFKNRIAMLIKNLSMVNLVLIGGLHFILVVGLSFYYLLLFRFKEARIVWRALIWNIVNFPATVLKRSRVQKMREVSDRELFKIILKPINVKEMVSHFVRSERMLSGKHAV